MLAKLKEYTDSLTLCDQTPAWFRTFRSFKSRVHSLVYSNIYIKIIFSFFPVVYIILKMQPSSGSGYWYLHRPPGKLYGVVERTTDVHKEFLLLRGGIFRRGTGAISCHCL